jgi:hypothetical protein
VLIRAAALARSRGIRELIAYHDRTRHTGCIYRKAGFRKAGIVIARRSSGWGSRSGRPSALDTPTSKRRWQLLLLAVALLAALVSPALADEIEVTQLTGPVTELAPGPHLLHLVSPHFVIDRDALDRCNADGARVPELERQVLDLSADLVERSRPEPGWRIATRWTAIGLEVARPLCANLGLSQALPFASIIFSPARVKSVGRTADDRGNGLPSHSSSF